MQSVRETLAGRYDLLDVIGRGGMGVVYRARDRVLERDVAVKVLPGESAGDPARVARFEREARAAGALNHPSIVAVFDTGREAHTHFIVMEYLAGRSLTQLVRERGRFSPESAVQIAAQVAGALAAAHRAGIIHRDVKPANVMVDDSGAVKVLDFGIARAADGTSLTQTAVVLGSAPYLAPEVTRGERADERSDIYSLGCLLYELLTGRPPFTAELPAAVMHQHNTVRPIPPHERNPEVPPALDALVIQTLAKRPNDRPQSAQQLATALGASLEAPHPASHPASWAAGAPSEPTLPLTTTRRFSHGVRVAAVAVVLVVAGLVIGLLASSGGRPRQAAAGRAGSGPALTTHHSPTTSTSRPQAASTPRSSAAAGTVPATAGALTTLITQDLQSGALDQHGQDLLGHLQDIVNSYEQGHASDALHKVDDLMKHVGDLADHGDIRPSALPAITTATDNLRAAILRSSPSSSTTPGAPPATKRGDHPGDQPTSH